MAAQSLGNYHGGGGGRFERRPMPEKKTEMKNREEGPLAIETFY